VEVEVKLYASLRRYRPETAGEALHHPFFITLPAEATIATLASALGIPDGLITAAALNDVAVEVEAALREGDKVGLFPPSAGGCYGRGRSN
jgi:molybdopterin converting factor small subunit